ARARRASGPADFPFLAINDLAQVLTLVGRPVLVLLVAHTLRRPSVRSADAIGAVRAVAPEHAARARPLHLLEQRLIVAPEARRIGQPDRLRPAHRDRLEIFRTQRSAGAPAGRAAPIDDDAGLRAEVFTGGADACDTNALVAELASNGVFGIPGGAAPQRAGIAQFRLAVADGEIDGMAGFAADDELVEAGE